MTRSWLMGVVLFAMAHLTAFASGEDYVFDPLDRRHVLYVPEGSGPFPAILLLHTSGGIETVTRDWAARLQARGFVVYVIDSFTPRGWEDRRTVGWERATTAQLTDVRPAYEYLAGLAEVDASRIGLLGFSMGGFSVLEVMRANPETPSPWHGIPFRAAASFYGVCHRLKEGMTLRDETRVFIGDADDRAPVEDCQNLVQRSQPGRVSITLYPEALHGFDNFEFPASKELVDEKGEVYHIGFSAAARERVLKDLPRFFEARL